MDRKQVYNINIEEVKDFFSLEVKKDLKRVSKEMKLTTLGDLFELYETKEFMRYFVGAKGSYLEGQIKNSYVELIIVIKLLKYKYLGIDPQLYISDESLSKFIDCLVQMGISFTTAWVISEKLKGITSISKLIDLLCDKRFLEKELLKIEGMGPGRIKEILVKAQIIKQYLEESSLKNQSDSLIIDKEDIIEKYHNTPLAIRDITQNKDITDKELKELYKQLEELLQRSQNLNEQILVVRNKINEIMNMEASNGSKRKK